MENNEFLSKTNTYQYLGFSGICSWRPGLKLSLNKACAWLGPLAHHMNRSGG